MIPLTCKSRRRTNLGLKMRTTKKRRAQTAVTTTLRGMLKSTVTVKAMKTIY